VTIQQWHTSFKVQCDSLDSEKFVRFEPELVDLFLNKSIDKTIQDAYKLYEETQQISDFLSNQLVEVNPSFNNPATGEYLVALPTDYYFHIQSKAKLKIGNNTGIAATRKEKLDDESKVLTSPFKKPDGWEIPIFFKLGGIYVYTGENTTLDTFFLTYLKQPLQISYKSNISSDLHPALHNQVISNAVLLALETYSSDRVQSKMQIN